MSLSSQWNAAFQDETAVDETAELSMSSLSSRSAVTEIAPSDPAWPLQLGQDHRQRPRPPGTRHVKDGHPPSPAFGTPSTDTDGSVATCRTDAFDPLWFGSASLPTPSWDRGLEPRFRELVSLPHGWDGYDGQPVSASCACFAASLLGSLWVEGVEAPQLVPGPDGTLQIEWHVNQFDIEIDVLGPYHIVATRTDLTTGREDELEGGGGPDELTAWVRALGESRPMPQGTGWAGRSSP